MTATKSSIKTWPTFNKFLYQSFDSYFKFPNKCINCTFKCPNSLPQCFHNSICAASAFSAKNLFYLSEWQARTSKDASPRNISIFFFAFYVFLVYLFTFIVMRKHDTKKHLQKKILKEKSNLLPLHVQL